MKSLAEKSFGFVERSVTVFVRQRHQCTVTDQLFGDVLVSPEASVMQRRVAMLILRVYVGFGFDQHQYDVEVSVGGGEVKRNIFPHVCCVDTRSARQEHLNQLGVTLLSTPVQWTETVVVSKSKIKEFSHTPKLLPFKEVLELCHSPLLEVVFRVVQPQPDLDCVVLSAPVEDIFHFCENLCAIRKFSCKADFLVANCVVFRRSFAVISIV